MPFDDTSRRAEPENVTVGNTLASLGITPVPREVAVRHKKQMVTDFAQRGPVEANRVARGAALWRTIAFGDMPITKLQNAINAALSTRYTSDKTHVPGAIVDLARHVGNNIKGAEFSVAYFDVDPILYVRYVDRMDRHHHDCLGIWDQGEIVAIASGYEHQSRSTLLTIGIATIIVACATALSIALTGAI